MSTIFINSFWQSDWTPASPTTGGGTLPLVWKVPGVENYQDDSLTTPAVSIGDPVGSADNQGTDNFFVSQSTAANKPTLQQVTINSVTSYVWRFDGTNDYLQGAFGGGAISQPFTVFAVAKMDATAVNDNSNRNMFFDHNTSQPFLAGQLASPIPDEWRFAASTNLTKSPSTSDWIVWTCLANGASSAFWLSGVLAASGNGGISAPAGLTIGSNAAGSAAWKGDIGQYLIYPGNLSTADKNQVNAYLERVTGIAVATIT